MEGSERGRIENGWMNERGGDRIRVSKYTPPIHMVRRTLFM